MLDIQETSLIKFKKDSAVAMQQMKKFCDTDKFILDCRFKAYQRIKQAIKKNKNNEIVFNWSKLPRLLMVNTKLNKETINHKKDFMVYGLSFAPHFVSGFNTCNGLSLGCAKVCLMFTGMGQEFMVNSKGDHTVAIARIIRTILYFKYRNHFIKKLINEIVLLKKRSIKENKELAIRFNVFSEIKFESLKDLKEIIGVCKKLKIQCYDYVKDINRIVKNPNKSIYHLTYSLSENNFLFVPTAFNNDCNVAVVTNVPTNKLKNKKYKFKFPTSLTINGIKKDVIDGDSHDGRFLDKKDCWILLRGKGQKIKKDKTNFAIPIFNNGIISNTINI